MEITSKIITLDEIEILRKPFDKLHIYHNNTSTYFSGTYPKVSFEERIKTYKENAKYGEYRIELLTNTKSDVIGFCIIYGQLLNGKVEVLFIDENYRGQGFGAKLMNSGMDWFKQKNIKKIELTVVYGNKAESFYRKFGFYPCSYIMKNQI